MDDDSELTFPFQLLPGVDLGLWLMLVLGAALLAAMVLVLT